MPPQEQCFATLAEEEEPIELQVTTVTSNTTATTMQPQHEHEQQKLPAQSSDDVLHFFMNSESALNNSSSDTITTPCFRLGAWGDEETDEQPTNLPFAFPESLGTSWDDDSQSCDWSVASSDASSIYWDAKDEAAADFENSDLRVRFCPDLVSDVRHYTKPCHEDCKNMYYTAHELQHMIDDFVRAGGTSLLSPA